jgi:glycosyltransferase involved in cell wall biosynthesis
MENQCIICFANDWENDPTSKHQVMKILSRKNRILWVDSIGMRRPSVSGGDARKIGRKVKKWFRGLVSVSENLHHFTPMVLPLPASPPARSINKRLLLSSVSHYVRKLDMKNVQVWIFVPNAVDLLGSLNERLAVYYCVDEWSKFSFIDAPSMRDMEERLLRKADLVITTADHLYRDKIRTNSNTHLVTHGVDYGRFSNALRSSLDVPAEIRELPKPIIGFFGLLHEWIDLELIAKMADAKPEWSIVLIGNAAVDTSLLKGRLNVHLLGRQPYDKLPGYCKGFDLGIIPFRVNDLTMNVNPIKLKEYLAAGLPVVSTPLPEVEKYAEVVEIGRDGSEFIFKAECALKKETPERRIERSERMKEETWEHKVEEISLLVTEALRRRGQV